MTASPPRSPLLAALAAAACLLPAAPAAAAALPAGTTAILSGSPALDAALPAPVAAASAGPATVSQDGRFVAFVATSDGLVDGDDDTIDNVYVKDRETGAVTLASRATGAAGAPARQNCFDPAISDDGRRVAFACFGPLDPADTNAHSDVYVRDLPSSSTVLVSRAGGLGAVGDGDSRQPALDEDGDVVAFTSAAKNLDDRGHERRPRLPPADRRRGRRHAREPEVRRARRRADVRHAAGDLRRRRAHRVHRARQRGARSAGHQPAARRVRARRRHRGDRARQPRGRQRRDHRQRRLRRAGDGG